ncbi:MAG: MerR family transcriptional regulator [Deltaproteobacteria bacterium]|nr:MerR family transcriptional regulator [Deltaproteobacteria bacterium]
MNKLPKHMKISELSAYAGTSITAIRFYLREGLLPKPLKTSKTMAYYTEDHLNALLEVQKLKEEGLPLEAIKEIVREKGTNIQPVEENITINTAKKEQIIKTSVKLFREKGYGGTKISDIPARAGISKGTFYQYFRNKEDLFIECADSIFREIGENIPEIQEETDPIKKLQMRGKFFGQHQQHVLEMLNLIRGAAVRGDKHVKEKLDEVIRNLTEPLREDLEKAMQQGQIRTMDSRFLAYMIMGSAEYFLYYSEENKAEVGEIMRKAWDMNLNGFLKDRTRK